jgi:hypothetical protein
MDVDRERKHKRKGSHHEHDRKKSKKRHGEDSHSKSSKKSRHKAVNVVDDDAEDDQMWVEHNIDVDGQHVSSLRATRHRKNNCFQPVTTTIPTGASLQIQSTAGISEDTPDPPKSVVAESKMKREEWMLLTPSDAILPASTPPLHSLSHNDALTEEYGEQATSGRTIHGQVDFFSSLGTEHRPRNNNKDKPNPEAV